MTSYLIYGRKPGFGDKEFELCIMREENILNAVASAEALYGAENITAARSMPLAYNAETWRKPE